MRDLRNHAGIAFPLYLLVLLLPLEPPRWTLQMLGLELTMLETAAGLALLTVGVFLAVEGRLGEIRRSPLMGWAPAFLAACILSACFALPPRLLPIKFTLRVVAGITAFALTSMALRGSHRILRLMEFLALAGTGVALVGLAEASGVPGSDAITAVFRDQDFEVGGSLRIASTFYYPNTAAGFLVLAIPGALLVAWSDSYSRWIRLAATAASILMFTALLLTYSRGALLGALFVPSALALWGVWQKRPGATRMALATLAGFLALAAAVTFGRESFRLRTVSEGDRNWYRAEFHSPVEELFLEPGELARTPVSVRNIGKMAWETGGAKRFHLSYRWFDLTTQELIDLVDIEGERTSLPKRVEPGEKVELLAYVRAPSVEGRYFLIWDMVQEHTTWFSEKGGGEDSLRVTVGYPATSAVKTEGDVVGGLVRASWRPGRLELWSLAVRLFAQNPWLGVGPDNFRWRYGPAAGRENWDTRTFSNSLYLETLATTGIIGAACFFGLLGTTVYRLYRLTREKGSSLLEAALAASLGGFLVHGLFDYLLEFTSIYLAFWILLGALSALIATRREEALQS